MSGINFRTRTATARVSGSERAYAGILCHDLLWVATGIEHTLSWPDRWHRVAAMFPDGHYIHDEFARARVPNQRGPHLGSLVRTAMSMAGDGFLEVALNTAMLLGNDAVRLLARLHGQCEIHAWVADSDREWLAGIIEEGRATNVLRPDMGWEAVRDLLLDMNGAPGNVYTDYTVTDSFPSLWASDPARDYRQTPVFDATWEAWDALTDAERWDRAEAGMAARPLLRLTPNEWETYVFDTPRPERTGFDIALWLNAAEPGEVAFGVTR